MDSAPHDQPKPSNDGAFVLAVAAVLALAIAALYAPTLGHDFVGYDDDAYVVHNPRVNAGLTAEGARWALTATAPANWHPLTLYSHMLDVELFGLEPAGHHATALLLHVLNTWLVFLVLRSATGALWRSAFVALLFAVHPLHVEAVAWVSQRKTLLSTGLGWLSIAAYLGWVRRGGGARFALCAAALFAALAAKSMLVTLPVLLLLLDAWPLERLRSVRDLAPRLREKALLFGAVLAVGIVTVVAQAGFGAVAPWRPATFFGANLPNAVHGAAWYVAKLVWPSSLAVHYPHPYLGWAGGVPLSPLRLAAATALVLALSAAAVRGWRSGRAPWLAFGWAWLLVALLPVLGFAQVGTQAVADRYAYGPYVGAFVVLAWGLEALRRRLMLPVGVAVAVVVVSCGLLFAVASRQVATWRDSRTLYERAIAVSPRDTTMLFNLGNAFVSDGERDEAEVLYRRALAIHPGHTAAQLNLAELLRERAEFAEAIELHRRVLLVRPTSLRALEGLDRALRRSSEPGRSGARP